MLRRQSQRKFGHFINRSGTLWLRIYTKGLRGMRKIILLMILMCHLGMAEKAIAAHAEDALYQAEVPVASQSQQDKQKGMEQALANVLVKVSGNNDILSNPNIAAKLVEAESLAQEFSFDVPHTPGVTGAYILQVRFDADAVDHLLHNAKAPILGQARPVTIAWVEFEEPNKPAV